MRTPRLYQKINLSVGNEQTLDLRASHHLAVVLRAKIGSACELFNGDGFVYHASIVALHKKQTTVKVIEQRTVKTESNLKIHWAQCISSLDRMDYTIQKATELGVSEITPILSQQMGIKWNEERAEKRILRWQNIAVSASEQSFRAQVPVIHDACKLTDFIKKETHKKKFILDIGGQKKLNNMSQPETGIMLLVGPESGFSQAESQQSYDAGFISIEFGPRILRTETAAPAVLAVVQHLWGDI